MYDVITVGSATRDVFIRSSALQIHKTKDVASHIEACFPFGAKINVDELHFDTGGGATNNAVTFSRMGKLKTATICRIGTGSNGEGIVKALRKDGVDTALVQRTDRELTGYSTILLSGAAERTILVHRGASSKIENAKIPWNRIKTKLFYLSSLAGDLGLLRKILACAKRCGAAVYMNPGGGELKHGLKKLAPLFAKLDLLVLNREEATLLTGKELTDTKGLVRAMRSLAPHSVLTDGPAGAYAITQPATYYMPVIDVKTVNLTGAGDAFGSAFTVGFMKFHDVKAALALGSINATSVVQHTGAKVGILKKMPTNAEIGRVRRTAKLLSY